MTTTIILSLLAFLVGCGAVFIFTAWQRRVEAKQASGEAARILDAARREAERIQTDAEIALREKSLAKEQELERVWREKRKELQKLESDLESEEARIQKLDASLKGRQGDIVGKERKLQEREAKLEKDEAVVQDQLSIHRAKMEEIAAMTSAEAKAELMRQMEASARKEAARIIKRVEENAHDSAKSQAKIILLQAVEKLSPHLPLEGIVSVVKLPSEDMKGRIIGREGRNIRTFERIAGVDVIVDDTPEIIMLACHNPLRREIAKLTLEKLVEDGRIHPARIEETHEKCREIVESQIFEQGKEALFHLGILTMNERLAALVGRMKLRTTGGQNLLEHCIETAKVAAYIAQALGIPAEPIKRAAILHEIGHIEEHLDDTHPAILASQLAKQYGESPLVVAALAHLHPDHPSLAPEAHILAVAEQLALTVPGVSREGLERYVEHLDSVERLVMGLKGPEKVYAIKAGRELLVLVDPKKIDDEQTIWLAKEIVERIEKEIRFAGQIKVQVIRESRAVDFAT